LGITISTYKNHDRPLTTREESSFKQDFVLGRDTNHFGMQVGVGG
jgi:hypothetical protein